MPTLRVEPGGAHVPFEPGQDVLSALRDAGMVIEGPCNGKGTCGKCLVGIVPAHGAAPLPAPDQTEHDHLARCHAPADVRLACCVRPSGDAVVRLLDSASAQEPDQPAEGFALDVRPDAGLRGLGLAVDVGTTTMAALLVDRATGVVLSDATCVNPQKQYGQDVLSRIAYENEHPQAAVRLQQAVVGALDQLARQACEHAGVAPSDIRDVMVAANCTMTHMLVGIDARPLGKTPYTPAFEGVYETRADALGLHLGGGAVRLRCIPHASAYIGGDIVAGAVACGIGHTDRCTLFVDVGTNGEIVLARAGQLVCCSCAMGPAFEGMNISCGMRAAPGAVEDVRIEGGAVRLGVIGGQMPRGLCGSGILAAVCELLACGLVRPRGAFVRASDLPAGDARAALLCDKGGPRAAVLCASPSITVTQSDVRQVQLAKAALSSGIAALLQACDCPQDAVSEVLVAGQFGAHLPVASLTGTGMLPHAWASRVRYVGNTSLAGARMALLSSDALSKACALASRMRAIDLAHVPGYDRLFARCGTFPSPDSTAC